MDTKLFDSSIIGTAEQAVDFIGNILQSSTEYSIIGEDIDGKILLWNEGARRLFGYEPEEVVGKANSYILHVSENVQAGLHQEMRRIALREGKWEGALIQARKNGQHFTARLVITPRHDSAGKAIGYLLISKDISVEIRLTEELKATQFYARSLIEASLDPLVTISPEGKITDVNRATELVTGIPRQLLTGTDFSDYFTEPDRAREGYQQVFSRGLAKDFPLAIRHTSARITDVLYNASVYKDDKGNVLGVFAAARDVTGRKMAEELQRASSAYARSLIEASLDPLVTISARGKITDVNEASVQATGVAREQLVGTDFSDYFTEPDKARSGYQKAFSEGFVRDYPLAIRHASGRILDVLYNAGVYKDDKGNVLGVFAAARDVTERRQMEAALMDADRRKDEFLAILAHELRNPLAAVSNSLELMKRASGNAAVMERAHATMERQMGQMVHLIDDLLDVSRITRNRIELRLQRVDFASVVQHAAEASRPHCEQAGHLLHVTLPPEPIALSADPMRLAQILGNLLNNACKYTPSGGHIWLSAERQGGEVALVIKDSGVGIAPDMLQQVFELFTQVGTSIEQSQGGLGIGLSLAKRLTELHGGTLTARSEGKDQGSEFVVRLPVFLETTVPATPVPITAIAPQTAVRRILVVDDKRDSADSLAALLEMDGDETLTAYDGAEAVASAAAFRPDVILLDIGMPRMNGYDACRAIRQQAEGKRITIIAMTGWGQDKDHRKSLEAGFDHHLVKPVDFQELLALLAEPQAAKV